MRPLLLGGVLLSKTATFYINRSDDRKVDKALTQIKTTSVDLKGDTNLVNPTIKVIPFASLEKCNYVYLADFERYYFVREITYSQQYVFITLECDVLYTYRDSIRNVKAIVKRQETNCNYYLDDEKYKALEYSRIQTFGFSTGFTQNAFLLTIAGGR